MSDSHIEEQNNQARKDAKSAKKFMFILMLIPIGLGAGVVLSNINFRKNEEEKSQLEQFKVSQLFNKADLKDDMEKIFNSGEQNPDYFLRHISSTLGINNYLTRRPSQETGDIIGFYDIKGKDEKNVTAVIVEVDESNPIAKAALLAVPTAVIKSLAGERDFTHTLRFVFLPHTYDGDLSDLKGRDEEIKSQYILRAGGEFTLDDDVKWRSDGDTWQHPAMVYPHESVSDSISDGKVEISLQAARELKSILQVEMTK